MGAPTPSMKTQCAKCPWRKDVNPHDIPGGYDVEKHRRLCSTIADPGDLRPLLSGVLRMMACHETTGGRERPCIGWLANQLGPGNNIALRLAVCTGKVNGNFKLVGEQHATLEETIPEEGELNAP
jgi:hypothetical protein